jgi:hypothetical protein
VQISCSKCSKEKDTWIIIVTQVSQNNIFDFDCTLDDKEINVFTLKIVKDTLMQYWIESHVRNKTMRGRKEQKRLRRMIDTIQYSGLRLNLNFLDFSK